MQRSRDGGELGLGRGALVVVGGSGSLRSTVPWWSRDRTRQELEKVSCGSALSSSGERGAGEGRC